MPPSACRASDGAPPCRRASVPSAPNRPTARTPRAWGRGSAPGSALHRRRSVRPPVNRRAARRPHRRSDAGRTRPPTPRRPGAPSPRRAPAPFAAVRRARATARRSGRQVWPGSAAEHPDARRTVAARQLGLVRTVRDAEACGVEQRANLRRRFGHQERPGLGDPAIAANGANPAPGSRARLEQRDLRAGRCKTRRRSQSGCAAANHGDPKCAHGDWSMVTLYPAASSNPKFERSATWVMRAR